MYMIKGIINASHIYAAITCTQKPMRISNLEGRCYTCSISTSRSYIIRKLLRSPFYRSTRNYRVSYLVRILQKRFCIIVFARLLLFFLQRLQTVFYSRTLSRFGHMLCKRQRLLLHEVSVLHSMKQLVDKREDEAFRRINIKPRQNILQ